MEGFELLGEIVLWYVFDLWCVEFLVDVFVVGYVGCDVV